MKKLILILFCAGITLQSCDFGLHRTYKNNNIASDIKQEIAPLNKKLFNALVSGNKPAIKNLMSPGLADNLGLRLDTIVNMCNHFFANQKDFSVLDEYYVRNLSEGTENIVASERGNINDYKISYKAMNKEMFVALLKNNNTAINGLILAVYGKYDNDWKLNILWVSNYSVLNKTAPQYYLDAIKKYKEGNLIDAQFSIAIAKNLCDGINRWVVYNCADSIKALSTQLGYEVNAKYVLPHQIDEIVSKPRIFNIDVQFINDSLHNGIYPLIRYQSNIKLQDTAALRLENDKIQKLIGQLYQGIDKNKKYILYQAFNKVNNQIDPSNWYRFVQKLN